MDGSRKTVIFYNTSISALLESGEREFEKMRDVFRVFEENRDKAALLWRPHPLIKAAIEAMKPELRQEYEELVCEYRKGCGPGDCALRRVLWRPQFPGEIMRRGREAGNGAERGSAMY